MQGALRAGVDAAGSTPRAPNFVVLRLRRASYMGEYGWDAEGNLERLRRDLEAAYRQYIEAHGWGIGGSGTPVINLVLVEAEEPCTANARVAQSFYDLSLQDDRGVRPFPVGAVVATVGRMHEPYPRGFVPVHDARKIISREHLELLYRDLRLWCRKVGRNLTRLNGAPMGVESVELHPGDRIDCGPCAIVLERIADG